MLRLRLASVLALAVAKSAEHAKAAKNDERSGDEGSCRAVKPAMPCRSLAILAALAILAVPCGAAVPDDHYGAAENLLGAGRWMEAAECYGRFAQEFPDDARAPRARFRRGEALFRAGRLAEALAAFNKALAASGAALGDPRARFRAANTLYLLRRTEEAAAVFEALLAGKGLPDALEGPARYFLARSLLARGNPEGAKKALEAFRGKSGQAAAYVRLALGDIETARLRGGSGTPEETKQRIERALLGYRGALEAPGGGKGRLAAEALFGIGELLRRSGEGAEALGQYRRAVEAMPSGPVAPYARLGAAWASLQSGDAEGALEEISAAAGLVRTSGVSDPRLADELAYARGTAELAAGNYEAASKSLSPLLGRKTPTRASQSSTVPRDRLLQRLAWSAIFSGEAGLAARAASALLDMDPPAERAAEARLVLAEAELVSGRPAEALEQFQSASDAVPLGAYGRARALSALGKPSEAAAAFDDFSRKQARHPLAAPARALAARAYLASGDAARAAERFREARAAYAGKPLEAEIVWGASLAEYMRRDFDAMAALDREILRKFPDSPRAADAAYWIAWSRLEKKDFTGAAEAFRDAAKRAMKPGPGGKRRDLAAAAMLEAASALERAGDGKGALSAALDLVTGELAASVPIEAVLWTADALGAEGETRRAAGILDAALERAGGGEARSHVLYARAELMRGAARIDEAIGLYDRAIAASSGQHRRPDRASSPRRELAAAARLGKARCLVAKGRRAEAEVLLENTLDITAGWGRAAAYYELGELRLARAGESEGDRRARLALNAAEDFMFVVLLYEPEGPGEGAELCARALLGAARACVLLERYASARDRLEQLITHPLYRTMPEAREARKIFQQIPVEALGTRN